MTEKKNRRDFLKYIANSLAVIAAGVSATGIVAFLFPNSFGKRKRTERLILSDSDFPDNKNYMQIKVGEKEALIIKEANGLRAFDLQCTHAGCTTEWQEKKNRFFCACHNGIFDSKGKPISGPPKKPLDELIIYRNNSSIIITEQVKV